MKTAELVEEVLLSMGLVIGNHTESGFLFKYQLLNVLYYTDEHDETFIRFALPSVFDVTNDNLNIALMAAERMSDDVKVAKACFCGEDSIWIFFEHYYNSPDDLKTYVPKALNTLFYARSVFYDKLKLLSEE